MSGKTASKSALRFVVLIGIISLFADFTYEGARSINGQFLASLGASATVVGFVAGFGELLGYSLRFLFGAIADRTGKYWMTTIIGYTVNLLAVPALALAGSWPVAVGLILAERAGRAVRKPAIDTMLSYAGSQTGQGWAFGMHEALDQTGATLGPLALAVVLFFKGSYHQAYALLLIPAGLALATVIIARVNFPKPHNLDTARTLQAGKLKSSYWWYMAAGGCIAAGFADFALIGFHFQKTGIVSQAFIPVLYAIAMSVGAFGSIILGKLFDRMSMGTVTVSFFLSALFAPLVFLGNETTAVIGMILWGLGSAAQESLLKSLVAVVISGAKKATAFGLFDTGFGVAWFLGSWFMGYLYTRSITGLVIFSVVMQLLALPIFWIAHQKTRTVQG
jgi:MFS family permease